MTPTADEALERLVACQSVNGALTGEALRAAANGVAAAALPQGLALRACDAAGERMIGAALVLHPACAAADGTSRLDGLDVLLVSGAVAGPFGVMQAARLARNLGARNVRAFVLGGWPGDLPGVDGPVAGARQRPGSAPPGRAGQPGPGSRPVGRQPALSGSGGRA